ncbi:energy transducer TonB, partial [Myxococcus sp. AM009]|nr:energy transducer TonB [Myxococcus sp. AM009]
MSQAVLDNIPTAPTRDRSLAVVGVFLLVSLGLHVGGFWALGEGDARSRPAPRRPVEMVMVEVVKPPPPLIVGMTMSSTTSAGSFAAPVGNTAYGRTGPTAKDPKDV